MIRLNRYLSLLSIMLLMLAGCGSDDEGQSITVEPDYKVNWTPPFSPISFSLNSSGEISISGAIEFVTPLGSVSIGASIPIYAENGAEDLILVLRNSHTGVDTIYKVVAGKNARIVVDGLTTIEVGSNRVIVDVTNATVVELSAPEPIEVVEGQNVVICKDARPSSLSIGGRAEIAGDRVNIRSTPEVPQTWDANIITAVSKGEIVDIIGGPTCAHGGYWWRVKVNHNIEGWAREETSGRVLLQPSF